MLSAKQLAERLRGVGSSEVAAIVGLSPYEGPFDVWARKTGRAPPKEQTAEMEMGHRLEPVVLGLYSDRVAPAEAWGETLAHPEWPIALATPDGRRRDRSRLVECKTVNWRMRDAWGEGGDGVPEGYLVQCAWQMFVTGLDACDLAALFDASEFRVYALRRDDELIGLLRESVARFWRDHIEGDAMPALDGADATRELLTAMHPRERAPLQAWTAATRALAEELAAAKAAARDAKAREGLLANRLRAAIGDAEGFGDETHRVTWRTDARGRPRWEQIARAAGATPALIARHTSAPARVLRLHGFGQEDE